MLKKIGRNDPCWCGSGKKYKDCHLALDEKINSYKLKGWKIPPKKIIKRPDQIDGIRESGRKISTVWSQKRQKNSAELQHR